MAGSFRVEGAGQLNELAADLKRAERSLRREALKGMRLALVPAKQAVKDSARENLPKAGGLNEVVAASTIRVRNRLSPRSSQVAVVGIGVRDKGEKPVDVNAIDQGRLRHPVFARGDQTRKQWTWVDQQVKPGWFTEPLKRLEPQVWAAVQAAASSVARKIEKH